MSVPEQTEIRAVVQTHPLGCAVACVAALCGTSYDEALRLFDRPELAWTRGFYCDEVASALNRSGLDYIAEIYDASQHSSALKTSGTLVFVGSCHAYPAGHYLLRSEQGWMNPWFNFPKMIDAKARFEAELPGQIAYVIIPVSDSTIC
jgi:hypothetical protein